MAIPLHHETQTGRLDSGAQLNRVIFNGHPGPVAHGRRAIYDSAFSSKSESRGMDA